MLSSRKPPRYGSAHEGFRFHFGTGLTKDSGARLVTLQKRLNIGFDSFLFLDDSSFERNLVRTALPDIQIPELPDDPARFLSELARWNLFEGTTATTEDMERLAFYQTDNQREAIRANYSGLDDFLSDLEMRAEVSNFNKFTLPRVLQLVQKKQSVQSHYNSLQRIRAKKYFNGSQLSWLLFATDGSPWRQRNYRRCNPTKAVGRSAGGYVDHELPRAWAPSRGIHAQLNG